MERLLASLLEKKKGLQQRLREKGKSVLEEFPITHYISGFTDDPPYNSYHYVNPKIQKMLLQLATKWGEVTLDLYLRLGLINLIEKNFEPRTELNLPPSIFKLYEIEFDRILTDVENYSSGFYHPSNDLFLKDLGLCRLKLVPVGSQLIEVDTGISRRILMQNTITQTLRAIWFFTFQTKGFKPFFQIHLDSRKAEMFNSQERNLCYLRVAEILKLNRKIKGLFGGSWFYDPQIEKISPRLGYLRSLPMAHGAQAFYNGSTDQDLENALSKSITRKQYYENGQYRPANYLLVWPRKELIAWAESFQSTMTEDLS